jgi:molybdopterin converting factor small subunit
MSIKVYYLGIIADTAGKSHETLEGPGPKTRILKSIMEKYPDLKTLNFVVSHNGIITHGEADVKDGDRITLIAPAPGG